MVSFAAPVGTMPPPPAPITKRPTMGLKRDSSYLDTDDEAGLSTNTKRLKVAFDDHVDVRIMDDWDDKSFELVKEEVRTAIQRHLQTGEQKDDTQYVKLLQLLSQDAFSSEAPTTKLLKKYILALNSRIAVLGECGKLVMALLDLSWLGRDEEFVEVYEKFLVVLASTHSKFISPMMERLVSNFERLPASMGRLPGEEPMARSTMFERLHEVIEHIVRRIPSASSVLMRMLRHEFPNDLSTNRAYIQYQKHLLQLAEEVPEIRSEVIALIMQRLVSIDVQIQQDLEDLDDEAEENLLQTPNARGANADAEEDDDSDDDSVSESEITTTDEEQRFRDLKMKVAKMDGTQDLLFDYYEPAFEIQVAPRDNAAYQELLAHFTSFVMPNRSRHAQFLLFHFAQTSSAYSTDFMQHFYKITTSPNSATPLRLTACAYLASFIARASHIKADQVRSTFSQLGQYLEQLRMNYEPHSFGPDRKSYNVYYAVAQALLYIFCFRWRDLVIRSEDDISEEDVLAEGRDLVWHPGVKEYLNRNIYSKLNPLKVCSPGIVGEFAKIANHLRFLYVFSILETNKRIRLGHFSTFGGSNMGIDLGRRETAWDRKVGDAHHQLEAYFPFDPYHLPQSKRWVEGEFNEWKLPQGMTREDDEEEEENEEEEASEGEYESDEESLPEDLAVQPPMASAGTISISS